MICFAIAVIIVLAAAAALLYCYCHCYCALKSLLTLNMIIAKPFVENFQQSLEDLDFNFGKYAHIYNT